MKKECTKCKLTKDVLEFYEQNDRKNGYSMCKSCFNKYCSERWIKRKIEAINLKGGCCEDCKLSIENSHYSVFEFHHLDPKEKDMDWKKMRSVSRKTLNKELDKCVLLCANCHRIRHVKDNDSF